MKLLCSFAYIKLSDVKEPLSTRTIKELNIISKIVEKYKMIYFNKFIKFKIFRSRIRWQEKYED